MDAREVLADIQHDIWVSLMAWVFDICPHNEDGSVTIPANLVERWTRQIHTRYADLSEKEKDSDRAEADKTLRALQGVQE